MSGLPVVQAALPMIAGVILQASMALACRHALQASLSGPRTPAADIEGAGGGQASMHSAGLMQGTVQGVDHVAPVVIIV